MRTTAKPVIDKLRVHILQAFEGGKWGIVGKNPQAALKSQINYMKDSDETDYQAAKRLVEGGQFLVYTFDVNNFMNDLSINDQQNEYTDDQTWKLYVHLLSREICKLIN